MKYKVRLAPPAASMYETVHRLATGEAGSIRSNTAQLLDTLLDDVIPSSPFAGIKLPGTLTGIYLISRQSIQIFCQIFPKTLTVVVVLIMDAPAREENARRADIICAQILQSGQVQLLPTGTTRRASAN